MSNCFPVAWRTEDAVCLRLDGLQGPGHVVVRVHIWIHAEEHADQFIRVVGIVEHDLHDVPERFVGGRHVILVPEAR